MVTIDPRLNTQAWQRLRAWVLARDGGMCQIRGPKCKRYATDADHIVSRAEGGDMWDPRNLRASCKPCNGGRSAWRTNAMRGGTYRTSVPPYDTRF
jgi:5-methylcytosine-specific restriction endonuclease McrA